MEKTSISTNVKDFSGVQRALDEIKKEVDTLKEKLTLSTTSVSESEGEEGKIRIIDKNSNESLFEIRDKEGWRKPFMGNTQIVLKSSESNVKFQQAKSIDEIEAEDSSTDSNEALKTIYDEKAEKFILPRPDYDSGWTGDGGGSISHTHNLGTQDFKLVQVSFNDTGDTTTSTVYNTSGASSRAQVATVSNTAALVVITGGLNYHRLRIWK